MDRVGEYTLQVMKLAGWYNNWLFSMVEPFLGKEILEIGAGIGNFTELLSSKRKITAVDIDRHYIKNLKKNYKRNLRVGFGNIEKGEYFFRRKKFDTVICMNVLEHIKDDEIALKNISSLLKPGGKLVLLVPAHHLLFGSLDTNLGHFRRYDKKSLGKKLKEANFNLKSIKEINLLGSLGWYFNSVLLKRRTISKLQLIIFDKISRPFLMLEEVFEVPVGLSIFVVACQK